jgi:hypothetical protein
VNRVEVYLVDGPIAPLNNFLGGKLRGPPEVRNHVVRIVHRFYPWRVRPSQEECTRAAKGLNDVIRIAQPFPDQVSHARLAPEKYGKGARRASTFPLLSINVLPKLAANNLGNVSGANPVYAPQLRKGQSGRTINPNCSYHVWS